MKLGVTIATPSPWGTWHCELEPHVLRRVERYFHRQPAWTVGFKQAFQPQWRCGCPRSRSQLYCQTNRKMTFKQREPWFKIWFWKLIIYRNHLVLEKSLHQQVTEKTTVMVWIVTLQNSFILIPSTQDVTIFGNRAFKELIKAKWGHMHGP